MCLRLYKEYMRTMQNEVMELSQPKLVFKTPLGIFEADKQKCKPKDLHEFTIKGTKVIATSRKDAIKKYNHMKNK